MIIILRGIRPSTQPGAIQVEPPLFTPVFRSETQARLLSSVLLGGDELSLTKLAELTGTPYATAHREVARLLDAGILAE